MFKLYLGTPYPSRGMIYYTSVAIIDNIEII